MKNISKIKDGVLIIVLLFLAWKGNNFFTQEPEKVIVEKVEWKEVEVPIIQTVTRNIIRQKDTVIYITRIEKDTITVHDTLLVRSNAKLFNDTINLDSNGYVEARHVLIGDDLRSFYRPFLSIKERTITETNTVIKNNNYISAGIRYDGGVQVGLDLMNRNIIYGVDYDPVRKNIGARVGYVFFKY
jgi:hypothetical protein